MSGLGRKTVLCGYGLLALACGAERVSPEARGAVVTPGECGRGLVVVESDYQSSNVSLLALDGSVLTPSLASSQAQSGGFSLSLGGDAAPPASTVSGPNVVILDRMPKGVLHFIDIATAKVTADLSVSTGFSANPHDYLAFSEQKAYVARYDSNPNPGTQQWDAGGDILIVDPSQPGITGRIDLTPAMAGEPARFTPHPSQLVRSGGRVFVLLASYAADYMSATSSRLVELDEASDAIVSTLVLDGLKGCDVLALSPDQSQLAAACSGAGLQRMPPNIADSGLALIDISESPKLLKRFDASAFGQNPLGFAVDYVSAQALFFGTLGYLTESNAVGALDSLIRLDTTTGGFEEVLRSESTPFTLGGVRCAPSCGVCFAADAERAGGSVLRFSIDAHSALGAPSEIRAESEIGLPPRYLGGF